MVARLTVLHGALLALLVSSTGCGMAAPAAGPPPNAADATAAATPYRNLGPQEAARLIEDPSVTVVNVHIPYEGEVPGTDLHIPFNDLEPHLDRLPADRNAPILLYCRSGRMSEIAGERLAALGYTNLLHLDGGMNAWAAGGFALEGVAGSTP